MSDEHDDDDLDLEGGSQLVKDLRRQLKAEKKRADEAAAEAEQFKAAQRKASVSDLLTAKKAPAGLARFFDGDPTEEAVSAWLTENAELFGITVDDEVDDETAAAAGAISRAAANAPGTKPGSIAEIHERIANAQTPAELAAAYAAAGVRAVQ